ncbi:olfactory receptor 14I1-like [Rhineura floridana]|uniref:olfactory receptor 14I1-like n=1 Tax=Rhineura floridana TaxID=261503 RepID=UPI002AC88A1E|nr:olfactory receptor 14I1-like [Rhineura floridana]
MNNITSMSTFLLREFSELQELRILYLFLFLTLYLTTMIGNLLIIVAVALDHHLHTPMYFFLTNLAMMDIGSVSVIIPKSLANSMMKSRSISYCGCVAQVFFYLFFATSGVAILTVMAHDRYVAICNPLQYERIMHKGACLQMAAVVLIISLLYSMLHTSSTFANTFCSNAVNQFFCEIPTLLKLSCSDFYLGEVGLLLLGCIIGLGCFIYITITYLQIFSTVLRIPSLHGQKKALSTCLPHLIVVSVFLLSAAFAYARPPTESSSELDIAFAVIYTLIPPMLNPFIYSMRNKDIKTALWKLLDVGHSPKTMFRGL